MLRPVLAVIVTAFLLAASIGAASASGASKPADHGASKGHDAKPKKEKGGDHGGSGGHDKAEAKPGREGLFASQDNLVVLPTVIVPVLLNEDGRLSSHLYLFLAALTATAAEAQEVRMHLPYVQDALVRDAYRHALVAAGPDVEPDTAPMIARVKDVINIAVGKPLVTEIQVGRIDTAPY